MTREVSGLSPDESVAQVEEPSAGSANETTESKLLALALATEQSEAATIAARKEFLTVKIFIGQLNFYFAVLQFGAQLYHLKQSMCHVNNVGKLLIIKMDFSLK